MPGNAALHGWFERAFAEGEPNEQGAIGPMRMQPTWRAVLQDIELMPQHQDFGL